MSLKTLVGAGAVGALLVIGGSAAQAATNQSAPSPTAKPKVAQQQPGARAHRLCGRIDKAEQRVDRRIARLSAGPGQRGSVKWLQARAAAVRAKDPARADLADGRVRIQQSKLNTLQLRKQQLPKVAKWCDTHGAAGGK
ncbi:MAG: hypothetical protein JWO67_3424 [Streptosporangiaceae bacterium]|jgi:hypothetical protein|nr:hypothetical protein [Streptosporangiaceae bacterium]